MTFQRKPKQKNLYPQTLVNFEQKRIRDWAINKASLKANWKSLIGGARQKLTRFSRRFSNKKEV